MEREKPSEKNYFFEVQKKLKEGQSMASLTDREWDEYVKEIDKEEHDRKPAEEH